MKKKYLKNLNKEIDLKRINLKTRERSVENRKKKNELFNFNTNSPNFNYETINNKRSRNKDLIITKNKKSNSKPTLDINHQIKKVFILIMLHLLILINKQI